MWELFRTFFQIGLFTFGGGYAMIAQIKEVVVEKKQWLTDNELVEVIAIAESTPGPIAINLATYVGYRRKGVQGSLAATLGVILPSFVILYVISLVLDAFLQNRLVACAFKGIKCAVAFLILKAGMEMFAKLERKLLPMLTFLTVLVLLIGFAVFSVSYSTILLILAGGSLGIVFYRHAMEKDGAK